MPVAEVSAALLRRVGFSVPPVEGIAVLPAPLFGPVSRFNADGGQEVHYDQEKEPVERDVWWTREEWRGRETQEVSDVIWRTYWRYPRTPIPPPNVEFTIAASAEGSPLILAGPFPYDVTKPRDPALLHAINLFLEIFNECEVLTEDLVPATLPQVTRVNWTLLPEGGTSWKDLKPVVNKLLAEQRERAQPQVIWDRMKLIAKFEPPQVFKGNAGFHGYLAFEFDEKDLWVLESTRPRNATYIFGADWEALSKLTKREILFGGHEHERVIHTPQWKARLTELLTE